MLNLIVETHRSASLLFMGIRKRDFALNRKALVIVLLILGIAGIENALTKK